MCLLKQPLRRQARWLGALLFIASPTALSAERVLVLRDATVYTDPSTPPCIT